MTMSVKEKKIHVKDTCKISFWCEILIKFSFSLLKREKTRMCENRKNEKIMIGKRNILFCSEIIRNKVKKTLKIHRQ